jgi:hypothetical protein
VQPHVLYLTRGYFLVPVAYLVL